MSFYRSSIPVGAVTPQQFNLKIYARVELAKQQDNSNSIFGFKIYQKCNLSRWFLNFKQLFLQVLGWTLNDLSRTED